MNSPSSPPAKSAAKRQFSTDDTSSNAAWSIVSYVLSGILFWGAVGWFLDRWLLDSATSNRAILLPIGVVLGAVAGGYLGYQRFLHATRT